MNKDKMYYCIDNLGLNAKETIIAYREFTRNYNTYINGILSRIIIAYREFAMYSILYQQSPVKLLMDFIL